MGRIAHWPVLVVAFGACGPSRPQLSPIGEPCTPVAAGEKSEECVDGLCIALDSASGFCTRACTDDDACPPDYLCQAAGRYGRVCKKLSGCKQDSDCPAGHACNPDTGNCYIRVSRTLCSPCQDGKQCPEGGACFRAIGSLEQFCTAPCDENGGCPVGFSCQQIPAGPDGALVRQCAPVTSSCNLGKPLCASCEGDVECGGPFDLCVRNVVSGETFCGKDCDPKKNVCPTGQEGCDPTKLGQAKNPECPDGFSCTHLGDDQQGRPIHQCTPNSNTCKGYCDAPDELGQIRQCGLGQQCDLTTKQCRPATDGRMCSPCLTTDDCRRGGAHPENRCIVNNCQSCPFKGESFCSTPCADDGACVRSFGVGFVCKPVTDSTGSTVKYCMPQRGTCKSGLGQLGADCSQNGEKDCITGICLVAGTTSLCSLPCTKDGDCADARYRCCEYSQNGYDCSSEQRTAFGPKSGSGVCAPLGGLFGDDCSIGRPPCQTGTCLDLGTARVCTLTCGAGQSCPADFTCRKARPLSGGAELDVCFPAGGGKPGAECRFGPAACESGLCIKKDSGPVCTAPCTTDAECPEEWRCTAVRTVDERSVQACLPPYLE